MADYRCEIRLTGLRHYTTPPKRRRRVIVLRGPFDSVDDCIETTKRVVSREIDRLNSGLLGFYGFENVREVSVDARPCAERRMNPDIESARESLWDFKAYDASDSDWTIPGSWTGSGGRYAFCSLHELTPPPDGQLELFG